MPWGAVVGAVIGGVAANNAANKGANATKDANNAAILEQQRQYDQSRQDQLPFLNAAYTALGMQQNVLGGDFSQFYDSPDYAYTRDESLKALDRSAASHGAMFSGGADADRIRLAQGLASQNFNNWWDRLRGMTGQGQGAAQSLGNLGANMAGNVGSLLSNSGQARASSYLQQGNTYAGLAGALGNAFGNWYQQRQQPQSYSGGGYGQSGMYYSAPSTASGANWTNAYGYTG